MKDSEDKHILVVDDEPDMCWNFRQILEAEGYKVSTANGGEEAIDIVKKGNIDLIIMDVMLPGIDGIETYRRTRKIDANLPIIMITGYPSTNHAMEAIKLGVVDYITKPFSNEYIINLIKSVL
ncbi:MAG: response regulator [Proteobacteria bacterium]|nr:response regulator [Pseudomonadota bacterium]MBU4258873.1 response regulator [Pseudomonadota bacterium]MBU4288932.1 response regulator [Pseudomonadota bacterium]MBU4415215.1 response regulator [Pseudomonadota bacterium]MCG2758356.1 response regulator [Desulfobacteraceae bacterium]